MTPLTIEDISSTSGLMCVYRQDLPNLVKELNVAVYIDSNCELKSFYIVVINGKPKTFPPSNTEDAIKYFNEAGK